MHMLISKLDVTLVSDDSDITVEEVQGAKAGQNPEKAIWAFSL